MQFPAPLGDGVFDAETRQEKAIAALNRLAGEGGFGSDPDLLFRRTMAVLARLVSSQSLTVDRIMEQIFPGSAHADDSLPDWELSLQIAVTSAPVEDRRAIAERKFVSIGAARGLKLVEKLEEVVGAGNATYRFNRAADLATAGADPIGIFYVAFEVPADQIQTLGQLSRLRGIVNQNKPAHVVVSVTRTVARGFLCDDDLSLTDRDVLDT